MANASTEVNGYAEGLAPVDHQQSYFLNRIAAVQKQKCGQTYIRRAQMMVMMLVMMEMRVLRVMGMRMALMQGMVRVARARRVLTSMRGLMMMTMTTAMQREKGEEIRADETRETCSDISEKQ